MGPIQLCRRSFLLATIIICLKIQCRYCIEARSWDDIQPYHSIHVLDSAGAAYIQNKENLSQAKVIGHDDFTDLSPSNTEPTIIPSDISTENLLSDPPSLSTAPTMAQKDRAIPTSVYLANVMTSPPSISPSLAPSAAPTPDPFEPSPEPSNPDPSYFNYNLSAHSLYGPGELGLTKDGGTFKVGIKNNNWGKVNISTNNNYWLEFTTDGWGAWKGTFNDTYQGLFTTNVCEKGKLQSPIDLRESGGSSKCREFHEVRSMKGDFKITGDRVKKQILSNKLRLLYDRRPCTDKGKPNCEEPDPPHADFPLGWGGFVDVMHIDIKVPSEHYILGERFHAEMQIFHLHAAQKRFPVQSVLIRAEENGYNYYFQVLIDTFLVEYRRNSFRCGLIKGAKRKLVSEFNGIRRLNRLSNHDTTNQTLYNEFDLLNEREPSKAERQLQLKFGEIWDPYHPMLIPSIWFYRYDGSLTEPPCAEIVTWFISDKPMVISIGQLNQLKLILLTNRDGNCQKTSVHFGESVARPVRQVNNRPVWRCTPANFGPDTG